MTHIKRYSLDEIEDMVSRSDSKAFKETSEKDILEQSLADPDTPVLTEEDLREMEPAEKRSEGDSTRR